LLRDPIIMNCAGETIASWRRALGQTNGHKRRIFGRAAIALLRLTKNEQASERQSIIDEPPRPARRSVRSIFEKTPRTGSYRAKELSKAQERLLNSRRIEASDLEHSTVKKSATRKTRKIATDLRRPPGPLSPAPTTQACTQFQTLRALSLT
jgi:hypothetical protein